MEPAEFALFAYRPSPYNPPESPRYGEAGEVQLARHAIRGFHSLEIWALILSSNCPFHADTAMCPHRTLSPQAKMLSIQAEPCIAKLELPLELDIYLAHRAADNQHL